LREFLVSQVKLILQYQPDVPWLSITQNDNEADCMDPEEMAIVAEEGGDPPCIGTPTATPTKRGSSASLQRILFNVNIACRYKLLLLEDVLL
jgi:hypothetical protein